MDLSRRDNYCTNLSGDSHCRGLRITMNNTFTAGGRCAPAFVCVYGLTPIEMPSDKIIMVPIKGLVASSNLNGSTENGFIVFIRGKYVPKDKEDVEDPIPMDKEDVEVGGENEENDGNRVDMDEVPTLPSAKQPSKEAHVAQLYRETVYYPFLAKIRTENYDMPESSDTVPDNLTVVCWMDG